ncbi:hypothetical protein GW750_04735 [bacterium]|nr:hypothetical protein [bacterium]
MSKLGAIYIFTNQTMSKKTQSKNTTTKTQSFEADVQQLIQLVTHSIYSNKEVFLRELVSNANDAIQKAKIMAAQDTSYL